MHKVVIADDELFVRMGLRNSIDWEQHGFVVVGEAADGVQALGVIDRDPPDVVLTDIKMPNMDGLELIRIVSERYPLTRCIVLSNFDDFELVKNAMKLGATDYFLKVTIEPEKLLDTLRQTVQALDQFKRSAGHVAELSRQLGESRPLLLKQRFRELRDERQTLASFARRLRSIPFFKECMDGHALIVVLKDYDKLLASRFDFDRDLLEYTVTNLMQELLYMHGNGQVFESQPGVFALFLHTQPAVGLRHFAQQIHNSLQEFLSFECFTVYGLQYDTEEKLRDTIRRIFRLPEQLFYERAATVRHIAEVPERPLPGTGNRVDKFLHDVAFFQQLGDGGGLLDCVRTFVDEAEKEQAAPDLVKKQLILLVSNLLEHGFGERPEAIARESAAVVERIECCCSILDLRRLVSEEIAAIGNKVAAASRTNVREEIRKVIVFMEKNYGDKISLEDMANYIRMNKSYFSRLFKQETGMMFNKYLTQIRLTKARELILSTNKKLSDISDEVGYGDVFYFTKAFKHYYSMTPGEYKKRHRL
ncbi:MAG TPA: response regulator [Paenibacillus sp.]|nr:response regulator [Paenibacillus sp.]